MKKKENTLSILATKLNADTAEAFKALAEERGTTVSRMMANYVKDTLAANEKEPAPTGTNVAILSYKNVDRLKHEVAFHNPNHLNPDKMLNHILDLYFDLVKEIRK